MGKLGIVWAGFITGISLSDLVLFATLVYTVLNIGVLVWERIIKPWRATHPHSSPPSPSDEKDN